MWLSHHRIGTSRLLRFAVEGPASPNPQIPNPQSPPPVPTPFPTQGRLLGLDYGKKRLGVAVSDSEQTIAAAVSVIPRSSPRGDLRALQRIVEDNQPVALVVGLPVHMSGDEGTQAGRARELGTWASRALGLPVRYWDERHSSTIAEGFLLQSGFSDKKRKGRLDALAAQVMLQSYLDAPDRSLWDRNPPVSQPPAPQSEEFEP